jgi:FixJ family two-component response regulator
MSHDRVSNTADDSPVVYIIDDDACIRAIVSDVLGSEGIHTEAFASALEFLPRCSPLMRGCLLLDMELPEISGLELQRRMVESGIDLPIVFFTGHGDVSSSSLAFRSGAVDFLEKPTDTETLITRIREALAMDREKWHHRRRHALLAERFGRLTGREREVAELVVTGYSTKEIARLLRISNRTIDVYRARIMEKTDAKSLADLISMYFELYPDGQGSAG